MNFTNVTKLPRAWLEFSTRSSTTIAVETTILVFFGFVSTCGNLLVIIAVCCSKSLRTVTNTFVVSLAVASFLVPTAVMPLTVGWSVKGLRFKVDHWACDLQAILIVSLIYISVINIALMAVNRYVRVCKPQKHKHIFSQTNALIMIGATWSFTFALCTMVVKATSLAFSSFVPSLMVCLFVYKGRFSLAAILGNVCFLICVGVPLTIMFVCYYKVFRKIRQHKRSVGPSSNGRGLGTSVKEVKITWTLFTVLLGYLLSWIPALVIQITANFLVSTSLPREVRLGVTYNILFSTCINPFIYGAMNPAFRSEYAKILKLKKLW